jgi:hypothetical protein
VTKPRVVLPGIIVGALLLGLAVVFAVLLPKAQGATGDLALPDSLPGGYIAADTSAAYAALSGSDDATKQQYADQQVASNEFAAKSFKGVDVEGVSRNYLTKDGQEFIAVQLIRAEGGALSPFLFSDPAKAQSGQQLDHLVKAGDATCIETGVADGNGGIQQSVIQCQKSEHGLTLQLTTQNSVKAVGTLVDDVWDAVS